VGARSFWALPPARRDKAFGVWRREAPVFWSGPAESDLLPPELNTRGFWSLTRYDDIRAASRTPRVFSSAAGITMEDFSAEMTEVAQSFIAMDPPRHTQLRAITEAAFGPRNLRVLRGWLRGQVRELVDAMTPWGEGDFVEHVARPLPARIFGQFFGLSDGALCEKAVDAARRLLSWTDPQSCGPLSGLELFAGAVQDLHQVAMALIPERRERPGEDLLSWVAQARWDGQRMTDSEIAAFFTLLAVAANDTIHHGCAHAVHLLSRFPDQRALLVADPSRRVAGAVEETLRWATPLVHMRRTATAEVTIRGQQIRAGEKVVLWYCSGNRDEDIFTRPHLFDIHRHPNPHLSFGAPGPHACLGAALARSVLRTVLRELYTRIPDIHAAEPQFLVSNFVHGIKSLPATWTPTPTR
jgi:cytochrome P450